MTQGSSTERASGGGGSVLLRRGIGVGVRQGIERNGPDLRRGTGLRRRRGLRRLECATIGVVPAWRTTSELRAVVEYDSRAEGEHTSR